MQASEANRHKGLNGTKEARTMRSWFRKIQSCCAARRANNSQHWPRAFSVTVQGWRCKYEKGSRARWEQKVAACIAGAGRTGTTPAIALQNGTDLNGACTLALVHGQFAPKLVPTVILFRYYIVWAPRSSPWNEVSRADSHEDHARAPPTRAPPFIRYRPKYF